MKQETLDPDPPPAVRTDRNGHAADGTFAKGNRCAAGRRSRADWREAFDGACSPADLAAIVRKAVAQAKAGDPRAREWIGEYALQRPAKLLDVRSALDVRMDGAEHNPPMDPNEPDYHVWD